MNLENKNILIISVERCGSSWPAAIITEVYEKMTGKFIQWHHEISRDMCINPSQEFPRGWVSVYNIDPNDIREGFDKVIVLSRNLETLKRVFWFYYHPEIPYEEAIQKEKGFFAEIESYHDLVYGRKVEDPKFFYVSLEDFNNYTVRTFDQLFDFLEIPKEGRPQTVPVNPPERNWQCFSDIYPRGYEVNNRLKKVEYMYALNQTESQIQLKELLKEKGDTTILRNREKGMRYEFGISPTSYKLTMKENKFQNNKCFRVNFDLKIPDSVYPFKVLVIGSAGHRTMCHPCENLHKAFQKIGISYFLANEDLRAKMNEEEYKTHYLKKIPIKISSIHLNFIPDFIFIDEGAFHFKNDTNIPIIYYHKYLHRPLSVKNADIVLFGHEAYKEYYEKFVAQDALSKTRYNGVMYPAVNEEIYKGQIKKHAGVCGLGYRRPFEQWLKAKEIAKEPHIFLMKQEVEEFKIRAFEMRFKYFESPLSDEQYRDLLAQMDVLWFPIARNQYITQRMLEAMACKTMCIFKLESKKHEEILKNMGYLNGVHYIGINDISEIKRSYTLQERAPIILEAYKQTLRNHTYNHRARYLYDLYNIYLRPRRRTSSYVLDLGCGLAKTEGAYGIDNVALQGVDLVYDLNKIPYPFDSNSIDKIIMNDILEHLDNPIDVIRECYRILKKDGELYIKVVYFAHKYAFGDPQHKHAFSETYFTHFLKDHIRSYVYDFHFSKLDIKFILNSEHEKQAMEVTLTK